MSEKKPYTGFLVLESILLVLAAVCSLAVGLLTYFGIFFTLTDALWLLIACAVVTVCALVLWIWFLCICSSLRKAK